MTVVHNYARVVFHNPKMLYIRIKRRYGTYNETHANAHGKEDRPHA